MTGRYAIAAGFVAAIVALLLVRDAGYLGGRAEGGPLTVGLSGNAASAAAQPGRRATLPLPVRAPEGEDVEIQAVRPDFASPGLDVRERLGQGTVELRADRPGVYFALGLTVDYKIGARRYRRHDDQTLCLSVGRRNACPLGYALPDDVQVAEAGGPSRFGVRLRESDDDGQVLARYPGAPGERTLELTLTNVSDEEVRVSDVALPTVAAGRFTLSPGPATPSAFRLGRGESRRVRLTTTLKGCLRTAESVGPAVTAEIDGERRDLPASVALEFVSACG